MSEWRFVLRVRYSPDDLEDLYEKDRFTYFFYYDQVRSNKYQYTTKMLAVIFFIQGATRLFENQRIVYSGGNRVSCPIVLFADEMFFPRRPSNIV